MERYQINDIERLTGVKAHTIRIWEKRYNLVEPHRSDTNIRYYDNEQVRKLLNISVLIEHGHKISKLARLSNKELNDLIISSSASGNQKENAVFFVNALTACMLHYDESGFEKTFAAALTRLGLPKTIQEVVYPFLHKVGILWTVNEAMPAQEHFASGIIRRKLFAAIDGLPGPTKKTKKFVLFLPPDEWHEIALLYSEFLIRSKGYPVLNLGQNVPFNNLGEVLENFKADFALTFFISRRDEEELKQTLKTIFTRNTRFKLLVSASEPNASLLPKHARLQKLNSPEDLLKLL